MDEEEGFEVYEVQYPTGLTFASFFWNMLTFVAELFQAVANLLYRVRTDVAVHDARKQEKKQFSSSVEAGIERLG